jgi:HSP20 family protein
MSLIKTKKSKIVLPSLLPDFLGTDGFYCPCGLESELNNSISSMNIKEKNKEFNIEFAAPGFNKNNFKVEVEDNVLAISAEIKGIKKKDRQYLQKKTSDNLFSRSFPLPHSINAETVDAKYVDGILKIFISKKAETEILPIKEIKITLCFHKESE